MRITKFLIFCLLFTEISYSCKQSGQNVKKDKVELRQFGIDTLVNQIANYKRVDTKGVGFAGTKTEQYERFEKLIKYAKTVELINLTNHQSPVVRAYSFWALTEKKFPGLELIVKKHANDTSSFELFSGCLLFSELVSDFYVMIIKDRR